MEGDRLIRERPMTPGVGRRLGKPAGSALTSSLDSGNGGSCAKASCRPFRSRSNARELT